MWLATWAGKIKLSCPLGTTCRVLREKFSRKPNHKSFIGQAFSVKMSGYWPRSCFATLWTSTPSRSDKHAKRTWPISSHLELTLGPITHMYLLSLAWNFQWLRINCNVQEQSRLLTQDAKITWQSLHSCQCVYQDAVVSSAKGTSRTNIAGVRPP